jgi:hypothetical protein
MRTTDPDPLPFQPLGAKVTKPEPAAKPQAPQGPSGIVTDEHGRMSTTDHPLPKGAP